MGHNGKAHLYHKLGWFGAAVSKQNNAQTYIFAGTFGLEKLLLNNASSLIYRTTLLYTEEFHFMSQIQSRLLNKQTNKLSLGCFCMGNYWTEILARNEDIGYRYGYHTVKHYSKNTILHFL